MFYVKLAAFKNSKQTGELLQTMTCGVVVRTLVSLNTFIFALTFILPLQHSTVSLEHKWTTLLLITSFRIHYGAVI
jgi:hypothetical protein